MAGTRLGGLKTAQTNKAKYGDDYYVNLGRKGGKNGHTGGFAANRELAREAGRKGGKKSRRSAGKLWWEQYGHQVEQLLDNGWYMCDIERRFGRKGIYYLHNKYGSEK